MKSKKYALTPGDVKAITAALSILPSYSFASGQNSSVLSMLCTSAGSKLINGKPLNDRELAISALAIDSAYKAISNEMSLDDEYKAEIKEYYLTYNKLLPIFAPFLDM